MSMSLTMRLAAVGGFVAAMVVAVQPAIAQDNGPTQTGDICMQQVYVGPTGIVQNKNTLNCTAGDIKLARATSVSPDSCIEGTTFTLTATFEVDVTANSRYDAGFFFRIDGGDTARGDVIDGGVEGTCSLSALDPNIAPALDLDGDTCGDLNSGLYSEDNVPSDGVTFTIPGVQCVGTEIDDPDNPGQKITVLKLPNCTSWHNNQGTVCAIGDPFDFNPDTKSKCVCDDLFTVPVIVETATLSVVKTAAPTTVPETGGTVTYSVQATNDAQFVSLTLTTLEDDIYGNIGIPGCDDADVADPCNSLITDNTCDELVEDPATVLGPGESANCSFKAFVSGNADDVVKDTVQVCGTQEGSGETICGDDFAEVTITDVEGNPGLQKTALSTSCTVDVTYQVVISNPSEIDTLTVDSLTDDKFDSITEAHLAFGTFSEVVSTTCETDGSIAPLGNYTCTFVGRLDTGTGPCSIDHTDTVTGGVTDDDKVSYERSDSATVTVDTTLLDD